MSVTFLLQSISESSEKFCIGTLKNTNLDRLTAVSVIITKKRTNLVLRYLRTASASDFVSKHPIKKYE